MAKKLDLSKVKELLLNKGERIGLGAAVVIAVLFLAYGIWNGSKSSRPTEAGSWQNALEQQAKVLEDRIKNAPPPPAPEEGPQPGSTGSVLAKASWAEVNNPSPLVPMFNAAISEDTKRRNPEVLSVESIKADYVRGAALAYDLKYKENKVQVFGTTTTTTGGPKPGGSGYAPPAMKGYPTPGMPGMPGMPGQSGQGEENFVRMLQPRRLVVVNAVFPLAEQYERFREALRLTSVMELMNNKDLAPRFLGFDVYRREIAPNKKAGEWTPLYLYDAKKEKTVAVKSAIDFFLREAIYDEVNIAKYGHHLYPTTLTPSPATPLPKLALGEYPTIDLPGIEEMKPDGDSVDKGPMGTPIPPGPMGSGIKLPGVPKDPMGMVPPGGAPGVMAPASGKIDYLPWKNVRPDLRDKFMGNYNVIDPMGVNPLIEDKTKPGAGMYPGGDSGKPYMPPGYPKPGAIPTPGAPPMGETMPGDPMNPTGGFGKIEIRKALIRFIDVDVEVGKSYEYSLQVHLANPNFGKKNEVTHTALASKKELPVSNLKTTEKPIQIPAEQHYYVVDQKDVVSPVPGGSDTKPATLEKAPVQIHAWIGQQNSAGQNRVIGDWVIGERMLLRRGEFIGRLHFMVETPEWDLRVGTFVLQAVSPLLKVKGKTTPVSQPTGVPLDLVVSNPNPLVVDFDGGKRANLKVGSGFVTEEAAIDMLILDASGKLLVRNSRDDTYPEDNPGAKERTERYETWSRRVREARQAGVPAGGPAMPGTNPMAPGASP